MTTYCDVYWGSHGCDRPHGHDDGGHPNGGHICDCCECTDHASDPDDGCVGAWPYYGPGTHFYGGDAPADAEDGQ